MQNIFQLMPLASEAQWVVELCDFDKSGREQDLWLYTSFKRADRNIVPSIRIAKEGSVMDINFTAFGTLIVSERFKEFFSDSTYSGDLELLPIELIDSHSSNWYAVNLLNEIDCLHLEKSRLSYGKNGAILCVYDICIDRAKCPANHFFSLKDWNICFLVSDRVKQAMEDAEFSGVTFAGVTVA